MPRMVGSVPLLSLIKKTLKIKLKTKKRKWWEERKTMRSLYKLRLHNRVMSVYLVQ